MRKNKTTTTLQGLWPVIVAEGGKGRLKYKKKVVFVLSSVVRTLAKGLKNREMSVPAKATRAGRFD